MPIIARSPTRVDLAGGTLDIAPMTRILEHKTTVNFGITLDAEVKIAAQAKGFAIRSVDQGSELAGSWDELMSSQKLPLLTRLLASFWHKDLPGLSIEVKAKSPAGAGLGGSSCLGIAYASALLAARQEIGLPLHLNDYQLVQTVQDMETAVIRVPTGCQDYWGGVRGGINIIRYPLGGTSVETLRGSDLKALDDLLIICYSGVSRASGTNNWAIFKKAFEGDRDTLAILNEIGDLSTQVGEAVKRGAWSDVFRLSEAEWKLRVRLWSDIETDETRTISAATRKAGGMFARVCGAGGGGVMAIFAEPSHRSAVIKAVEEVGGKVLAGGVSYEGTTVRGSLHA